MGQEARWVVLVSAVLTAFGLAVLYSASAFVSSNEHHGQSAFFLLRQLQGLGVGIVASMAVIPEEDSDLVSIDSSHLFSAHTTWIGFRRGTLLRKYMYDFAQLLAPHLDRRSVERAHRLSSSEEVTDMFKDVALPER